MIAVRTAIDASEPDTLGAYEAAYASLLTFEFARAHWPLPEHDSLAVAGPLVLAERERVTLDDFVCYLADVLGWATGSERDLDESIDALALGVAIGASCSPRLAPLRDPCIKLLGDRPPDRRGRRPIRIAAHDRPIWRELVTTLGADDRAALEPFLPGL